MDKINGDPGFLGVLRSLDGVNSETKDRIGYEFAAHGGDDAMFGARKRCEVDEVWIKTIEDALPQIGRAIEQARSFIKNDGEVVRIDRAKRTSKDSVSHLARHSNLIRHQDEDGRIIPDEIYVVENADDFAVYENRFLYLLLTQLSAFISKRYGEISRISGENGVSLSFSRDIKTKDHTVKYKLELSESSGGGEGADVKTRQALERIHKADLVTNAYLSTPLMRRLAGVPLLTPPIVRTNVIKNNTNFIAAFELYSFITSYSAPGYTVYDDIRKDAPVLKKTAKMLSDTAALQLFIAYQGAFDSWDECEAEYEEKLSESLKAELHEKERSLVELRAALGRGEISEKEYIAKLEVSVSEYSRGFASLENELKDVKLAEKEASAGLRAAETEAAELRKRLELIESERRSASEELLKRQSDAFSEKLSAVIKQKDEAYKNAKEEWENERLTLNARLTAEAAIKGEQGDAFDRDSFNRLEAEKNALDAYYKEQWAKAKRDIRRREFGKRKDEK